MAIFVVGWLGSLVCVKEWQQWRRSGQFPGRSVQTLRRLLHGEFDEHLPRHRLLRRLLLMLAAGVGGAVVLRFLVLATIAIAGRL